MAQADNSGPGLHIDSDWKAQAQAERERLAQKEQELEAKRATEGGGRQGEMPDASFRTLVGVLATQAMMGLGMYADRESGKAIIDLVGSRFNIDLLGVLDEKTRGNLDEDEEKELREVLAELRAQYVHVAKLVAQQMGAEGGGGRGAQAGAAGGSGAGPQIIQP